jgi:hypothetical protein
MSELKVNKLEPATANTVVVTPSVEVQNTIGSVLFTIKDNHTYIYSPINVGSEIDNSTGNAYTKYDDASRFSSLTPVAPQHLTSRGNSLSPEWTVGVPYGGIIMWWGLSSNIPVGWVLCDGVTRTINGQSWTPPDLRNRFVVGAGDGYSVAEQGGNSSWTQTVVLTTNNLPWHSHIGVFKYNVGGGEGNYTYDANKRTVKIQDSGTDWIEEGRRNPRGYTKGVWTRLYSVQ